MATDAQINANRQNAQKSTGPRTEEGKARSCMNNLSHGLRARTVVLPWEDLFEFENLCARLEDDWQPANIIEEMMLEQIAISHWKLAAFQACESEVQLNMAPDKDQTACLERLDLFRRRYEASRQTAIAALSKLQKDRKGRAAVPAPAKEADQASKGNPAPTVPLPPSPAPSPAPAPREEASEASFNPASKTGKPSTSTPPLDPKKVRL